MKRTPALLRAALTQVATVALTALGVATLVFILIRLTPGDPVVALLGDYYDAAPAEQIEELRVRIGVDQPIPMQYLRYLGQLAQGDFGNSFRTDLPVAETIAANIGPTVILVAAGLFLAVLIGVPVGVFAAVHRNGASDYAVMTGTILMLSTPNFFLGILAIYFFSFQLGWFPIFGAGEGLDSIRYLVLPAVIVGVRSAALIARMTRSTMLGVLGSDYIRTARAKGLRDRSVLFQHALRNAALPIVTIVGADMAFMLSGVVAIEAVFSRPGIGKLLVDGMFARDYPVVQGVMVVFAVGVALSNALVEVAYRVLDPRMRR